MIKNPFVNAFSASLYISMVVLIMDYGTHMFPQSKSIILPIAILSLFTLSAAVMGYLFLYQPAQLYIEGKQKQAVNLFLQTVGVFAAVTVTILLLLFSGILGR